eukprot:364996_1
MTHFQCDVHNCVALTGECGRSVRSQSGVHVFATVPSHGGHPVVIQSDFLSARRCTLRADLPKRVLRRELGKERDAFVRMIPYMVRSLMEIETPAFHRRTVEEYSFPVQ